MHFNLVNKDLLEKTSVHLLQEIVRSCPKISKVQVVPYSYSDNIQNRIELDNQLKAMFSEAMSIRQDLRLPFWDACMTTLSTGKFSVPNDFFCEVGRHISHHGKEIVFDREELLDCKVQAYLSGTEKHLICVLSEVILKDDQKLNLPLIDFHCSINPGNQIIVSQICKFLFPKGYVVLESDSSYHCYGLLLVSKEVLIQLLAKALLFSPIIDRAYIAHQLLEKRCSLRISGKSEKYSAPKVVEVFQEN